MNARMKVAAPLLLVSVGALAATGFANYDESAEASQAPVEHTYVAPAADNEAIAPAVNDRALDAAPPAATYHAQPRVTVTAPRPSEDELLRNAVMDRLAQDARLSGRIGVESYRHNVSLTGRVLNTMQVERAGMIARGVDGVRDVNNLVTARVGQS